MGTMRASPFAYLLAAAALLGGLGLAYFVGTAPSAEVSAEPWREARIPGASDGALKLGRDLDGDGDARGASGIGGGRV